MRCIFALLMLLPLFATAQACVEAPAIAIDVGHDRERFGSMSARGAHEWSFNLALGKYLEQALRKAGLRAEVINPDGERLALPERGQRAAAMSAALLLSIHHDSAQPRYFEGWSFEGKRLRYSDRFHGFSLFVSERNGRFAESLAFARRLGAALTARGLTPTLHHAEAIPGENRPLIDAALGLYRFDDLIVLHSAPLPAVLLEAGVIVNRDEELLVQTDAYRERIAAAVIEAVQREVPCASPPGT